MSKKNKECKELKNIKMHTLANDESNLKSKKVSNTDLDELLKQESENNKKEQWNKLHKSDKINKLNDFIDDNLVSEYQLNNDEINPLKNYLNTCLDNKRLKNSDIVYDQDKGLVSKILPLHFNKLNRKFTLKREKKASTLRSLAPKKNSTKRRSPSPKK